MARELTVATIDTSSWTAVELPDRADGGIMITSETADVIQLSFDGGTTFIELSPWAEINDSLSGETIYIKAINSVTTTVKILSFTEKR